MLGPTAVAAGCIRCRLYQDASNENAFEWVEEWNTRENLDRHIRSDDYRRILEALELADQPPLVRFDTISGSEGMELIAEVRTRRIEGQSEESKNVD